MKYAILFAPLVLAAAAWMPQEDAKIQDAIKNLGSEKSETREAAAAELRRIGAPALEALKKAAASNDDPEIRGAARRIADEIEKPPVQRADKVPQRAVPSRPGTIAVKIVNGDAIYVVTPQSGDAITFHKKADGGVKLDYTNDQGARAAAESDSIEKFLVDHKAVAERFGITADGIDYGGMRTSFNTRIKILPGQQELPKDFPGLEDFEELRKFMEEFNGGGFPRRFEIPEGMFGFSTVKGARVSAVPDVLRAHLSIPEGQGVVIDSVAPGSTSATLGLKKHDIILEADGKKITGIRDLTTALTRDSSLKVLRGGKESVLKAPPEEKKDEKPAQKNY